MKDIFNNANRFRKFIKGKKTKGLENPLEYFRTKDEIIYYIYENNENDFCIGNDFIKFVKGKKVTIYKMNINDEIKTLHEFILLLKDKKISIGVPFKKELLEKEFLNNTFINELDNNFFENNIKSVTLIHGPTNSGKTYSALQYIKEDKMCAYLAPLRLLAWEIYEDLKDKFKIDLVTGEEKILTQDANVISSTIEMFNSSINYDIVIMDESQMIGDNKRGGAWANVLLTAKTKQLIILSSREGLEFYKNYFNTLGRKIEIIEKTKLCKLSYTDENKIREYGIKTIPANSILVTFSRLEALSLKQELDNKNRKTSIIYGSLPPTVRQQQARRFRDGETDVCIATDAIGMGLNLPAEYVIFTALKKFDGKVNRNINHSEFRQISGRAGRFGKYDEGKVGILAGNDREVYKSLLNGIEEVEYGYISPNIISLEKIEGPLHRKLKQWRDIDIISDKFKNLFIKVDISEILELAMALPPYEKNFSLKEQFLLCLAPVNEKNKHFWLQLVHNLANKNIIIRPELTTSKSIDALEKMISEMDLFKWFSFRFISNTQDIEYINKKYYEYTDLLDELLIDKKVSKAKKCQTCGTTLAWNAQHKNCDNCFNERRYESRF